MSAPDPRCREAFEWLRGLCQGFALAGNTNAATNAAVLGGELVRLRKIEAAALNLDSWLWQNTGSTADWPVSITTDDPEVATVLVSLLQTLRRALHDDPPAAPKPPGC